MRKVYAGMTMITPEEEIAQGADLLRALHDAVRALRHEIEVLTVQAKSGEEVNETDASKPLRALQGVLGQCTKAEIYLNDCKNKQAGIAQGGYALDLDRARVEIGCKLDQLRRCSGSGPVSE